MRGFLFLILALVSTVPVLAQESGSSQPLTPEARSAAIERLSTRHRQWVQSVFGLMTVPELDYFLRLTEEFRRDGFMESFWEPRDPDPRTPLNELRERWEQYKDAPGGIPFGDPRFMLLLLNGPPGGYSLPDGRPVARCFSRAKALEIWFYGATADRRKLVVILQRRSVEGAWEVFLPGGTLRPVQRGGNLPTTDLRQLCADELVNFAAREIVRSGDYDKTLDNALSPPLPSPEWLANLSSSTTDLPAGAGTFEVAVELEFPERKQSRTAVRVVLGVPRGALPERRFDGVLFHNFQLVGEVIRDGRIFESFRYRFEGPTPEDAATIPLGFTRYLRPGPASLRILLEDVYSTRYSQVVREIEVPSPEGLPATPARLAAPERPSGPSLRLAAPPGQVLLGKQRFRAQATGELEKVAFYLDDKEIFAKRRPPYSVELDLGPTPEPRRVRVAGFAGGREVATDQVWLNQGAQRFRVALVEPRTGGIYPGSLTARAEVETPDGAPPERLELYLNDERVATLTEAPFTRSLRLDGEIAAITAVAYLADGSRAEDTVVVNAAGFGAAVEVRLVEIPALVLDAEGKPVTGLTRERFRVFEDGVPQEIQRFAETRDAPIHAAILIDRSASMEGRLRQVADAALTFASAAARSADDRIAVLSFAEEVSVDAAFTAAAGRVERALAGLDAGGGTALYDSLSRALATFEGFPGMSALVLFSDGRDEASRLTFEQALEGARRSGVTIYSIGLAEMFADAEARRILEELAAETGGRAYFLTSLDELAAAYGAIVEDLRSRYLLAYEPSGAGASEFRALRVEVDQKGVEVKARRGYDP